MRLEQRLNRPVPSTAERSQGNTDLNHDEYVRRANRFHAGKEPSSVSSAVVETVYRKPRAYADVHEYDERSQSIDRVPTAVGFHSFDSMDELKMRASRYEVEIESLDNKMDLDWLVDQIPDRCNASHDDEQTEGQETDTEREPPEPEEEETVSDIGRYATMTNDQSVVSEDSDSCPAVWVTESQEDIRLHEKDYKEALEDAKRVKELNRVNIEREEKSIPRNKQSSTQKIESRRGRKVPSRKKEEAVVETVGSSEETNSIIKEPEVSATQDTNETRQAAGWSRWFPHFLPKNRSNASKVEKSDSSSEPASRSSTPVNHEPSSRSATPVTTASTQIEASAVDTTTNKSVTTSKSNPTGPIDLDDIPTAQTSKEEPTGTKTSSTLNATSMDMTRSSKSSAANTNTEDSKYKTSDSKSRSSKGSVKSDESRESLRQKSLLDMDDFSNPPVEDATPEKKIISNIPSEAVSVNSRGRSVVTEPPVWRFGTKKQDDTHSQGSPVKLRHSFAQEILKSPAKPPTNRVEPERNQGNRGTRATENHAMDPPGTEEFDSLGKRSSGRSSSRRFAESDGDTYDQTEVDSYASSDRPVSNDDIIKAVRGEKAATEDEDVVKKIDGLTSWVIAGFDTLASVGLKAPMGFLDWSREEKRMESKQAASEISERFSHVQDDQGALTLRKIQAPLNPSTSTGIYPGNDEADAVIPSPRSVAGSRSKSRSGRQTNNENYQKAAKTSENGRGTRDPQHAKKHFTGKSGFVQQRIQKISGRESEQQVPAVDESRGQDDLNVVPSKNSAEVKSLKLETGVEVKVPDTTEQQIEQRNREILERRSRKLLRDNVSISSIEIPTPTRPKTEDEYSVSILGLRKSVSDKKTEKQSPVAAPEQRHVAKKPSTYVTKQQRPAKREEHLEAKPKEMQQRKVDDKHKSTTTNPKQQKRSHSPHRSKPTGKSPSAKKRQVKVKSKLTKEINKPKKSTKKGFSIFGRKKN
jgi:hypothetical protein